MRAHTPTCVVRILLIVLCVFNVTLVACSKNEDFAKSAVIEMPATTAKEPAAAQPGVAPPYTGKLNSLALINVRDAVLEQVLPPMDYPWAFEFITEDKILLTQIAGQLLEIDLNTKEKKVIGGLPEIGKGHTQIGLMDVELHPDFSNNQRIYFSYARPHPESGKYHVTEVATAVLADGKLNNLKTLINSQDFGWAPANFGGALEFDNNNYLYITIGDRGEDVLSRRGDRLEGKMLRLNADGSTPPDNPFVDKAGYDPRIYVVGIRNAQGLHFDLPSGIMFECEHGPLGGDEVNIITPGTDYGWPTISYGSNYATGKPMGVGTHMEGLQQPLFYFLPSIATSPLTIYRGRMFSEWDGDILIGALRGEHVAKLDYDENRVRSSQAILSEIGGRIRDIKVAKDGSIYILSQTTGLFRLSRSLPAGDNSNPEMALKEKTIGAESEVANKEGATLPPESRIHPGKEYYEWVCSGCHDIGASGAPVFGDYDQWQPILAQPLEVTKEHVLNGYNAMPERGFCYICSDSQIMEMVDYMMVEARKNQK